MSLSQSGGMADAADSKSAEVTPRVGSSPTFGTIQQYEERLSPRVALFHFESRTLKARHSPRLSSLQ